MDRLLKFYPRLLALFGLLLVIVFVYLASSSEKDKSPLSQSKLEASRHFYQGSIQNMNLLEEAISLDETNYEAWRELSIPYLKRGYPGKWFKHYNQTVKQGALEWVGARGCDYFYFYRDYERALADFNALDTITPNFTDYPQATSDLYLRALCYYGLEQYDDALIFLNRHIDELIESTGGIDFIDPHVFLYKGLVMLKLNEPDEAEEAFKTGLQIFDQSADLHFQLASLSLRQNDLIKAHVYLTKASKYFEMGYYNKHNYVEVLEQLYPYDLQQLDAAIQAAKS